MRAALVDETWDLLAEWQARLPVEAVFAGRTAAWLHGLETRATAPVEIFMPPKSTIRSRPALTVRRSVLDRDEATAIRSIRVTTLHRTLRDLSLFDKSIDALIAIDMALYKRLTTKQAVLRDAVARPCRRGSARLRRLVKLAEAAESPMETRLRSLLVTRGMPRPEVQTDLHDRHGDFVGRADLYYPQARLVVEFDGGNHRDRLVSDDRRQNALIAAGYTVLRYTSACTAGPTRSSPRSWAH